MGGADGMDRTVKFRNEHEERLWAQFFMGFAASGVSSLATVVAGKADAALKEFRLRKETNALNEASPRTAGS